jgi:DNA-directed RNA polymerase specialized sigma54-like protein
MDAFMSPERRFALRLLEASCSEAAKIAREELGDTNMLAAELAQKADWNGPDIRLHGTPGSYTVEVCNEPFAMLNLDDAPVDGASGLVEMLATKMGMVVNALRMRQRTLRRVADAFLDLQYTAPERPSDRFKRVSARQIAENAALHESTVQRAVANKVIAIGDQQIPFASFVIRP